ncbi:MAG: hypothetical protein BWY85_01046 [Firmicutes bacterium ADurb.Bin506]|nr:MAG: hypothetical protein BWY85_01046 [Firmicutes bacterium ADurb.Bin506]
MEQDRRSEEHRLPFRCRSQPRLRDRRLPWPGKRPGVFARDYTPGRAPRLRGRRIQKGGTSKGRAVPHDNQPYPRRHHGYGRPWRDRGVQPGSRAHHGHVCQEGAGEQSHRRDTELPDRRGSGIRPGRVEPSSGPRRRPDRHQQGAHRVRAADRGRSGDVSGCGLYSDGYRGDTPLPVQEGLPRPHGVQAHRVRQSANGLDHRPRHPLRQV